MVGLVLVFDMDQTLVDTYTIFRKKEDLDIETVEQYMNVRLLDEVLNPAVQLKGTTISAVILLSNNSLVDYVEFICGYINYRLKTHNVFDSIITRNGTEDVPRSGENPPKRLTDVETILNSIGKDSSNLAGRVYFFDDLHHEIEKELANVEQYYLIKKWLPNDANDYSSVRETMGLDPMPDLVLPPSLVRNYSIPLQSRDPANQTVKKISYMKRPSILGVFSKGGKRTRKKNSKYSRRSRRKVHALV